MAADRITPHITAIRNVFESFGLDGAGVGMHEPAFATCLSIKLGTKCEFEAKICACTTAGTTIEACGKKNDLLRSVNFPAPSVSEKWNR